MAQVVAVTYGALQEALPLSQPAVHPATHHDLCVREGSAEVEGHQARVAPQVQDGARGSMLVYCAL